MATRIFGPSKGNRRPTQVAPSKTPTVRPTAQKGGGGNKAAGSVEPTAETTPTVSVSPSGEVRTEHFGEGSKAWKERLAATREAHESRRRVRKVRTYVRQRDQELTPKREVHVSKDFLARQESPKPVTVTAHKRGETKVVEHQRSLPTFTKAEEEVLQRDAGGRKLQKQAERAAAESQKLKGTPEERQAARAQVRQAKKALRAGGAVGPARQTGTLTPQEVANALARQGRKLKAHLTPAEIAEGVGVAEAESGASNENTGQGPEGHIGIYSESPAFGTPEQRTTTGPATRAALKQFLADGRSWNPAWVHWQEIQGEEETGHDRAPQYVDEAEKALRGRANPQSVKNLKAAVKEARELGLKVSSTGVQRPGPPPKQVVTKYKAARSAMSELDKLNNEGKLPYVWGGHHGNEDSFDCSGAVSYVLEKLKVLPKGGALVSGDMGSVLAPGPGALTVFYNGEHTFIYDAVKKEFWGTSDSNVEGGAGFFPNEVGQSEVEGGNSAGAYQVGHIPGLGKKQALQMGGSLGGLAGGTGSSGSIPGMTVSPSGTTATIDEGVKVEGKARFSKKPIELTPLQQIRRRVRRLKHLGVEVAGPGQETKAEKANKPGDSSLHQQLAELEKRYSIGAV